MCNCFCFSKRLSQTCKTEVTKFCFGWSRWSRWSRSCCGRWLENPSGLWISFTPVSLAPSGRGSDFSVELLGWGSATGGNSSILQHDLRDLLGKQLTVPIESVWTWTGMVWPPHCSLAENLQHSAKQILQSWKAWLVNSLWCLANILPSSCRHIGWTWRSDSPWFSAACTC